MGTYSSDEDRRRSRRDRDERRRRSRTRSRSRSRSLGSGRRRNERRKRSRSRNSRRRDSRDRHERSRSSKRRRQHRSSSKSRRGKYYRSHSRSRSRSRKHRSRSSSYDRKKNRNRSMSRSSSRSESSSRHKDSGKDSVKKGVLSAQDSSSFVPSADALAKIESDGFVSEAFISHNSNKGGNSESKLNSQERSHEDAIFGTNGNNVSNTTASVKSNDIHVQLSGKESGIMASLLHEGENVKNDRWMKKLQSMREKKLSNT